MSDWYIKNISSEVKQEIKEKARERGLSIAKYLEFIHLGEVFADHLQNYSKKPEWPKEYKISLKPSSKRKLEQKALENGFNLSKYLEYLASCT